MDVRSMDSGGLAVKRLEMEHVRPVEDKQGAHLQKEAVHTVREDKHMPRHHEQGGDQEESAEESETVVDQVYDHSAKTVHAEHHVLDIKA